MSKKTYIYVITNICEINKIDTYDTKIMVE